MIRRKHANTDKQIIKLKCVTLGDSGVGKTSYVKRLLGYDFINNQESTLGATFIENKVIIEDNPDHTIKLQFWDTAGQERYRSLAPMYIRGANLAFVVCDITDRQSYISLDFWIESVINNSFEAEIIVIINKIDLVNTVKYPITEDDIITKLSQYNISYYFVSAKTFENLDLIKEKIKEKCTEKFYKNYPNKKIKDKSNEKLNQENQNSILGNILTNQSNKISLDIQDSEQESSYYNYSYNRCCYN